MESTTFSSHRLVKNEDLNHHGTLYAGRSAEWFVEAGFIAAASCTRPENIVCLKIHGMTFIRPVRPGELIVFESKIILAGRTTLHIHVRMLTKGDFVLDGFITFVHVDSDGKSKPHGITVTLNNEEDQVIQERLKALLV